MVWFLLHLPHATFLDPLSSLICSSHRCLQLTSCALMLPFLLHESHSTIKNKNQEEEKSLHSWEGHYLLPCHLSTSLLFNLAVSLSIRRNTASPKQSPGPRAEPETRMVTLKLRIPRGRSHMEHMPTMCPVIGQRYPTLPFSTFLAGTICGFSLNKVHLLSN